ncbi:unnamed protein product, partial [Adineta steineri]
NKDPPIVSSLSRLIEGVTNKSMIIAEDLQFSLGPANRITTWLTYLSDVEQGDETVFPVVDACFVLIINKWIDERSQEFRRSCVTRFNGMNESSIDTKLT